MTKAFELTDDDLDLMLTVILDGLNQATTEARASSISRVKLALQEHRGKLEDLYRKVEAIKRKG